VDGTSLGNLEIFYSLIVRIVKNSHEKYGKNIGEQRIHGIKSFGNSKLFELRLYPSNG
jgi:hypothetical protein